MAERTASSLVVSKAARMDDLRVALKAAQWVASRVGKKAALKVDKKAVQTDKETADKKVRM